MTLSPLMAADLQRPVVLMFCAVQIELPGYTLRLVDGAGRVSFMVGDAAATFLGRDPTYGALGGISEVVDGVASEAPAVTLTLLPKTNSAMAAIAAPAAQRSRVMIWVGDVDQVTGVVIGEPELWFIGETNVATQGVGQNSRALSVTVNSALSRFLAPDEGARLNNGFHQRCFPGELGLQYIANVDRTIPWGSDAPSAVISYPDQFRQIELAMGSGRLP